MNKNTPSGKGIRTAIQTVVGTIVAYFAGLWAVPGVQDYTTAFLRHEGVGALLAVLAAFGVSAGLVSFLHNKLGK